MVTELILILGTVLLLFWPYMRAKTRELEEKVRADEITNDRKEYNEKTDD